MDKQLQVISLREKPEYREKMITYFQEKWANDGSMMVYEDCLTKCIGAKNPLPQWYLLEEDQVIIGCAGLITNDFISRMDLYPWICALYIEESHRGHGYGNLLMDKAKADAKEAGFSEIHLCTDHVGYYEKYGFSYVGMGYHPWGESSRIYTALLD